MAPQIHLGPDGAERLWQRHHKKHTHTKKEKRSETEHSAPWQLHQLFALRWLRSMRRAGAVLCMLMMRWWYLDYCGECWYKCLHTYTSSYLETPFIWLYLWRGLILPIIILIECGSSVFRSLTVECCCSWLLLFLWSLRVTPTFKPNVPSIEVLKSRYQGYH